MSKKVSENTEEKQEKILTRYDLKMQRRAEEKKRAEKEKRMSTITGVVIVVALACLVASFPIRTYLTVNGTFVEVAGEKISRVEFDYNYNMIKNNYIAQNGYYMSMFGVNLNGDLSAQMYSDTMTWKDFFEQMTMESIINNKALGDQAKAEGYAYDVSQDYEDYMESLKKAAAEAGVSEKEYIRQSFGPYATASRLKGFVMESLRINAYYDKVTEEKKPSEEEIAAYYEENKNNYDSVDYRLITVNAQLPTEPTDLADPVEETEGTEAAEDGEDADKAYEPSEAEITFAMKEAREEAEEALKTISTEGELSENILRANMASQLRDWMFDSSRKAGDTTIIENTNSHLYYVAEFLDRYRDETPSVDARIVILNADAAVQADAVLEEWKGGAATEESFAEIADKYNEASAGIEGGLYEALLPSGLPEALGNWLMEDGRAVGDTTSITGGEGEASYVVYYAGTNNPQWSINISNTLLQQTLNEYLEEISEGYEVKDSKGNLNYLKVQAALDAAQSSEEDAADDSQGSDVDGEEDGTQGSNVDGEEDGTQGSDADNGQDNDAGGSGSDNSTGGGGESSAE